MQENLSPAGEGDTGCWDRADSTSCSGVVSKPKSQGGYTFIDVLKTNSVSRILLKQKIPKAPHFVPKMKKIARRQQQQQQQQQEQEQLGGTRRGPSRGGRQSNDDSEGKRKTESEENENEKVMIKKFSMHRWVQYSWHGWLAGVPISATSAAPCPGPQHLRRRAISTRAHTTSAEQWAAPLLWWDK